MKTEVSAVITALVLSAAGPGHAQDGIIRSSDTTMTCLQIGEEAAGLSQQMGGEPAGGVFGALGGVVRSGAAILIPGAGLAMAGADALTAPERERREAEAASIENRWYYLNGLYAGRGCAEQPAPSPDAPPASAAPVPVP